MAKPAKSERQKVIDDIKRKQRGADKRRGYAIVGVCVLIAVLIVGAAAYRPIANAIDRQQYADVPLTSIGAPAADVCQEVEEKKADGNQEHLPIDTPITYDTAPPAYGPHYNEQGIAPDPIGNRFYTADDRPALGSLVHNLEHGYTILWYDETAADDDEAMNEVRAIVDKLNANDTNLRLKFKAVPWTDADTKAQDGHTFPEGQHVALTAWTNKDENLRGAFQYCSEPSGEAVEAFMEEFPFTYSPEPYGG